MKTRLFLIFAVFIFEAYASAAYADSPLPPPSDHTTCSKNGRYCAFSDYARKTTTVSRIEAVDGKETAHEEWKMPGWYRFTILSDDGQHLLVTYEGANLLIRNFTPDQIMLSFYRRGELLRQIRLKELLEKPYPDSMKKTASQYLWKESSGMDGDGRYFIKTLEGREFLFDLSTGEAVRGRLFGAGGE